MSKRILAVDNSGTVLMAVSIVLEANGYKVDTAKDGLEALKLLKNEKINYSVVITDVKLPEMDGIALTSEIRKLKGYTFTPIIILTSESQLDMKEEGEKAGATEWIVKPVKGDELLSLMTKFCP